MMPQAHNETAENSQSTPGNGQGFDLSQDDVIEIFDSAKAAQRRISTAPKKSPAKSEPDPLHRFGVKPCSEFICRPDPVMLIPGLIPDCSLGYLVGKPGSAKSFLAANIAVSVATDSPLFGIDAHTPTRTGWVLVILGEAWNSWAVRMRTIMAHDGLTDLDNIIFVERPPNLGTEEPWSEFLNVVDTMSQERGERPALLLVDTLTACAPGIEFNGNTEMSVVLDNMQREIVRLGTAVMVLHHPSKAGSLIRGAYAQEGGVDWALNLVKNGDVRTLEAVKLRDFAGIDALSFKIIDDGNGARAVPTEMPTDFVSMNHALPGLQDSMRHLGWSMIGDDHSGPLNHGGASITDICNRWTNDRPVVPTRSENRNAYQREIDQRKSAAVRLVRGLVRQDEAKVLHGCLTGKRAEAMKAVILQTGAQTYAP